ncbi:uncharacterized protein SOCE836_029810 [Sorangium cellulosum]|uniref:Uncharacterized protein n=2 Tax=Polyangiaceae TaxID=49 RepID=A0A4P2QLE5_SORCE|nr:uncharacterized protein SOCE836_029810 [Sorangium cellulosum]
MHPWLRDVVLIGAGGAAGTLAATLCWAPVRADLRSVRGSLGIVHQQLERLNARCAESSPGKIDMDALARGISSRLAQASTGVQAAGAGSEPAEQPDPREAPAAPAEEGDWEVVGQAEGLVAQAISTGRWTEAMRHRFHRLLVEAPESERQRLHAEVAQKVNAGILVPDGARLPY